MNLCSRKKREVLLAFYRNPCVGTAVFWKPVGFGPSDTSEDQIFPLFVFLYFIIWRRKSSRNFRDRFPESYFLSCGLWCAVLYFDSCFQPTGLNVGCFYAVGTLLNRMIIEHYPVSKTNSFWFHFLTVYSPPVNHTAPNLFAHPIIFHFRTWKSGSALIFRR